jgi:hypothetical protein
VNFSQHNVAGFQRIIRRKFSRNRFSFNFMIDRRVNFDGVFVTTIGEMSVSGFRSVRLVRYDGVVVLVVDDVLAIRRIVVDFVIVLASLLQNFLFSSLWETGLQQSAYAQFAN